MPFIMESEMKTTYKKLKSKIHRVKRRFKLDPIWNKQWLITKRFCWFLSKRLEDVK
jgi:hypothetical protein